MFNGLWTVEFTSTINRYGNGVLVINDKRLLGGDSGYYYSGTCDINDNDMHATLRVIRYDADFIAVFGDIDHFELTFNGKIDKYQFNGIGTIADNPQAQINVIGTKKEDL